MSDFALEAARMERLSELGTVVRGPVAIEPPPWRTSAGGPLLVVLGLGLAGGGYYFYEVAPRSPAPGGPPDLAAAIFFGGLSLLALFGGLVLLGRRARKRGQLELFERGIAYSHGGRVDAIAYDDADDVRYADAHVLANGRRIGVRRLLTVAGRTGRVEVRTVALAGKPDGFGELVLPVLDGATASLDRRRKAGEPLQGDRWSLDVDTFSAQGQRVPLADLAAVGMFDGRVSLWKPGADDPFFSTPATARNARVLQEIVAKVVRPRAEDRSSLGRVLFHRAVSRALAVIALVLGVAMLAVGALFVMASETENLIVGAGLLLCGTLFSFGGLWFWASRFEARERGVEQRSLFGRRVLRYEEIERFSFSSVNYYHNGAYAGTSIVLKFQPGQGKAIRVSTSTSKGSDADLDRLRDQVSNIVAARWLQRVEGGAEMPWGGASIAREHLTFHAKKLFGKGELRTLPWSAPFRTTVANAKLALTVEDEEAVAFELPASAENFYPGALVLNELVRRARGGASGD